MSEFEREQEEGAAAEAARIGGDPGAASYFEDGEAVDPAQIPLMEAGEGEAEGFEQSQEALIENASHGDMHSAGRILEDATPEENALGALDGEADGEHTSQEADTDR